MNANPQTSPARPAAAAAPAPAGEARWQVRLLGAVEVFDGVQRIDRFPSRAVAALLARVALAPERAHSREELVELLWPGVALKVGRNRLRQVLSTLKSLLEAAGVPGAAVLQADRLSVRAVRGALACDALDFERLARAGHAGEALALYGGELMPGYYDEWIDAERQRLAALHERLLERQPSLPLATASRPDAAGPSAARPPATHSTHSTHSALAAHAAHAAHVPGGRAGTDTPDAPLAAPLPAAWPAAPAPALPTYLTRLFGADMAAARLRALVLARRLVTLLGPGGSGKTRLGVEVAQALRQPPAWQAEAGAPAPVPFERIAFVSLVACEEAPQMLDAIARALALPAGAAGDAADASAATPGAASVAASSAAATLAQALAGQRVLLVLDNFEQLVGRAEGALAELLSLLPALHVLVTSRRALGLDGEQAVNAEPLALPAADATLAAAAANPAVALFVDRARAARADFHLSERNHAAIVALARALHGMPLAIELAASRVRSFPPADMVALLAQPEAGAHLALLSRGGPRSGHDARHASMAQVIAWSWRLLDAPAQRLLGALTLFPADAPAAAVAAVVGDTLPATAARLDDLVAHSMVRIGGGDAPRFGLVEPVREFAAAQRAPADADLMRGALRRWLVGWAQGLGPVASPSRVAPELATVHAVLAAAASSPAAATDALQLLLALRGYWDTDGLPGRIQAALEEGLRTITTEQHALRADAHELFAYLRFEAGFGAQALAHADAALAAAGNDPARRARALVRRAWVQIAAYRGEHDATPAHDRWQAWLEEALALARGCGDREVQARALHQLAMLQTQVRGDWRTAETLLEESQALWLALGDRRKAYARLRNRAQCWLHTHRDAQAMASYEECERAALEDGDWVGRIDTLLSMTVLLSRQHRWTEALDASRRCVQLCWQRWHRHGLAYALWNPPRLLARLQRPEAAMRLMGFAATFWTGRFGPLGKSDLVYLKRVRGLVRVQVGAARAEALFAEGAAMDVAAAVALALQA